MPVSVTPVTVAPAARPAPSAVAEPVAARRVGTLTPPPTAPPTSPAAHRVRDAWRTLREAYSDIFVADWSSRQWLRARIFSLVFLGFLVGPVRQVLDADWSAGRQAATIAGIAAFGLCFGVVLWRNTPALHEDRARYAVVAAIAIGVALVASGVDWVTGFSIFSIAMLLYNCSRRWWLAIVVGVPLGSVVLNVVFVGEPIRDALMLAVPVILIGVVQAAFYQQVRAKVELARARTDLARLAVSEERLRIARDLHDILGQRLSAVSLKAELAARLAARDPARAAVEMSEVAAVAREALADVRETVSGYRSLTLATEIETARALLAAAGVSVEVAVSGDPLPERIDECAGAIVREAVTNVIRHAAAERCVIRVGRRSGDVVVEVHNNGTGTGADGATVAYGNGLTGLTERLAGIGGILSARGKHNEFLVRATMPLRPSSSAISA
jgi:two-component system sensor histidine kinase DesK